MSAAVDRVTTPTQLAERAKVASTRATEEQFKGRKGYARYHEVIGPRGGVKRVPGEAPDGSYKWRYRFQPNEGGKRTREGAYVQDVMAPWQRADTERMASASASRSLVRLHDRDGGAHYVEPALAEATARRNGWSERSYGRGKPCERGLDGMLFWWDHGAWVPSGRWCLGTPFTQSARPKHGRRDGSMPARGLQRDPEGNFWRGVDGAWEVTG